MQQAAGIVNWQQTTSVSPTALAPLFTLNIEVLTIDPNAIQEGTLVGTTAVPRADGSLSAVEVQVLEEAPRGTGEDHLPWNLQPGST